MWKLPPNKAPRLEIIPEQGTHQTALAGLCTKNSPNETIDLELSKSSSTNSIWTEAGAHARTDKIANICSPKTSSKNKIPQMKLTFWGVLFGVEVGR